MIKDSIILLLGKTSLKIFLLAYSFIAALSLTKETFAEFQLIVGLLNIVIQPSIIISLFITYYGSISPKFMQKANLRFMMTNMNKVFFIGLALFSLFFGLVGFAITNMLNISSYIPLTIASITIFGAIGCNYYFGYFQALENFRIISISYFLLGITTFFLAFIWYFLGGGLYSFLLIQTLSFFTVLSFLKIIADNTLKDDSEHKYVEKNKDQTEYLIVLAVALISFFTFYNLDIFTARMVLTSENSSSYIRIGFIGKISFLVSSAIATVVFPKASKAFRAGENSWHYFFKGFATFFLISIFSSTIIYLFSDSIFYTLFKELEQNYEAILLIILATGILQSIIYFIVSYKMAENSIHSSLIMLLILVLQYTAMSMNHDSTESIAINSLIVSIIGVILLSIKIIAEQLRSKKNLA